MRPARRSRAALSNLSASSEGACSRFLCACSACLSAVSELFTLLHIELLKRQRQMRLDGGENGAKVRLRPLAPLRPPSVYLLAVQLEVADGPPLDGAVEQFGSSQCRRRTTAKWFSTMAEQTTASSSLHAARSSTPATALARALGSKGSSNSSHSADSNERACRHHRGIANVLRDAGNGPAVLGRPEVAVQNDLPGRRGTPAFDDRTGPRLGSSSSGRNTAPAESCSRPLGFQVAGPRHGDRGVGEGFPGAPKSSDRSPTSEIAANPAATGVGARSHCRVPRCPQRTSSDRRTRSRPRKSGRDTFRRPPDIAPPIPPSAGPRAPASRGRADSPALPRGPCRWFEDVRTAPAATLRAPNARTKPQRSSGFGQCSPSPVSATLRSPWRPLQTPSARPAGRSRRTRGARGRAASTPGRPTHSPEQRDGLVGPQGRARLCRIPQSILRTHDGDEVGVERRCRLSRPHERVSFEPPRLRHLLANDQECSRLVSVELRQIGLRDLRRRCSMSEVVQFPNRTHTTLGRRP